MRGILVLLLASLTGSPPAGTLPPEVDDTAFRDALRERGLTEWLQQSIADAPAGDEVGRMMREREKLLAQAAAETASRSRTEKLARATQLLRQAIEQNVEDPRGLSWRLELVRDLLERREPEVFDALLLYEIPGADRARARDLAAQARQELTSLHESISAAWRSLESIDEAALARIRNSSSVRQLQEFDNQSNMLLCWARLYGVLAEPDSAQRTTVAAKLLDDISLTGWSELPAGQEARRCSALVMCAMAARTAGRFDEADRFARQVVSLSQTASPGMASQLRQATLLSVLEQVRSLRDSGKLSQALGDARRVADWAGRTRADEPQALIAATFLESSILARQQSGTTRPAGTLFGVPAALAPLEAISRQNATIRDRLYRILAGAVDEFGATDADAALQFRAGALSDAAQSHDLEHEPDLHKKLEEVSTLLQRRLERAVPGDAGAPQSMLPELAFLRGRVALLLKDYATAVRSMSQIVQLWPQHDRAEAAAQSTLVIARDWLNCAAVGDRPAARQAFIEAVRLGRKRSPDAPVIKQMQFFLAAVLEQNEQFAQAIDEYANVAPADPNYPRAALGRLRCLRTLVPAATQPATTQATGLPPHLDEALTAARQAISAALQANPPDVCLAAEAAVTLAVLANDPRAGRPADALAGLTQAGGAVQTCTVWVAPALREQVEAFRQLARWPEAVETFGEYLRRDPDHALAIGQALLESNRQSVLHGLESADSPSLRSTAEQGARLAETLLKSHHSATAAADAGADVPLRLTQAWLLTRAGQAERALRLYDACRQQLTTSTGSDSLLRCDLGRAECLLARHQPVDAMPLYSGLMSRLPEGSPDWWEAYVGTLRCNLELKSDVNQVRESIRQQRRLAPDLGGPRWRKAIGDLEASLPPK